MIVLFATTNPHKVSEVSAILQPLGYTITDLSAHPGLDEPIEDGVSFADNARIKARAYAAQCRLPCLAEDSGLEVEALGGRPGVHSARYSGVAGPRSVVDAANNEKLLKELSHVPWERRHARFVSAFCLARPDGSIVAEASGSYEGRIALSASGSNGFGYDPLFYLDDAECTSAELSAEEKNRRSHRGRAARHLAQLLAAD